MASIRSYFVCFLLVATSSSSSAQSKYRSTPIDTLTYEVAESLAVTYGFFDATWNITSDGSKHKFEIILNENAVVDRLSNLMWQQSGSAKQMSLKEAHAYVERLNREKFLGWNDWRLPTFEEAMSLLARKKSQWKLHIDPVFDPTQKYVWTSDRNVPHWAWVVAYDFGAADEYEPDVIAYVRAVRTMTDSEVKN